MQYAEYGVTGRSKLEGAANGTMGISSPVGHPTEKNGAAWGGNWAALQGRTTI